VQFWATEYPATLLTSIKEEFYPIDLNQTDVYLAYMFPFTGVPTAGPDHFKKNDEE